MYTGGNYSLFNLIGSIVDCGKRKGTQDDIYKRRYKYC